MFLPYSSDSIKIPEKNPGVPSDRDRDKKLRISIEAEDPLAKGGRLLWRPIR
jgi:hypothetical protein